MTPTDGRCARLRAMQAFSLALCVLATAVLGCGQTTREILLEREQVKFHTTNAQGYLDNGDWARAKQQAEKALDIDAGYAKARAILGFTYFQMAAARDHETERDLVEDLLEEAEEAMLAVTRDAEKTDVSVFKSYYGLGLVHQFRWERANAEAETVKRSLEAADPAVSPADLRTLQDEVTKHVDLAVRYYHNSLLTSMQRFDGAREALIKALYYRGRLQPRGRDYDRALELADDYLDKARTDAQVLREDIPKIESDANLSEAQKGQAKLRVEARLRALSNYRVRMLDMKAQMLAKRDDWPGVIRTFSTALQVDPDYSLLHYGLALAYAKNGNFEDANEELVQFAGLRNESRRAMEEELARLKSRRARDEEMRAVRDRIDAAKSDEFKLALLIAIVAMRRGLYDQASSRIDGLLLTKPNSVAVAMPAIIRAIRGREPAKARGLLAQFEKRVRDEHPRFADVLELSADLRDALSRRN